MIDIDCEVGERFDDFTVNRGYLDMFVVVTETGSFVNVQFEFVVVSHQVDYAVNHVLQVSGEFDIAFARLVTAVLTPAQLMLA